MGLPYDSIISQTPESAAKPRRPRRIAIGLLLLAAVAALVMASGAGARGPMGFWRHGHGDPELMRDHAAFMVERMLTRVDASPEQVEAVQGIVDDTITDLQELRGEGASAHAEVVALLTAEEIDRDALEVLRQEKLAKMDAATQRITTAFADVSEVLTPTQRAAVAEHIAERRARRHGSGRD